MNNKSIAGIVAIVAGLALASSAAAATFTTALKLGSTGQAVKDLQMVLNSDPATVVATTGAGSPGNESMYYGAKTKAAVIKFQAKYNIPQLGIVGPMTNAKLQSLAGGVSTGTGTSTSTTPVTSGPVTVSLSASQPSGAVVTGQAGVVLANFTLTGNGVVNALTLTRAGISDQSTLSNVYLYDGATRLTDGYSFNNSSVLTMNNVNLAVSGTRTISVRGDVTTSTSAVGQTIAIVLSGVTTSAGTATTSLAGNMLSVINGSGVLTTAALQTASPSPSAATVNAGSMNQTLWSNTLSVGVHNAVLKGMTLKMIGSAPSNTLSNVNLVVDGQKVGTATINANSQYVFDLSSMPYSITTGSHAIEVRGDVVGGAYRNFYLSLEKAADLMIYDNQVSGGTIAVTTTYSSSPVVNMNGGLVTISNGTLTINQDTSFNNTTNLVGGATNVKMAAFKFTAYGEDVKVNSLTFTPSLTGGAVGSGSTTKLANVGLFVNGGQVGSTQTSTHGSALTYSSLGSNLIVPVGQSVIVEIRGDAVNDTNSAYTAGTVSFALASGSSNAQGMSSGQLTSTASAAGQTLTITSTNVTFAQSAGWAASTVAPNQTEKKIGSFTVQTGSAEGITINNIAVGITGTMITNNQITNIKVKDGSTVLGTPVGTPTASNNFSVSLPVGISTTKTLDVYADIGSSAATYTVIPAMTITYRGATSNVTTTSSTVTGATITANVATIIAGGVTFIPSSSPVAQFVIGGTTNMNIGTFNIKSNNSVGGAVVKDVTFTVPVDTISSVTMSGVTGQVTGANTTYTSGTVTAGSQAINVASTVGFSAGDIIKIDGSTPAIGTVTAVNSATQLQVTITTAGVSPAGNVKNAKATLYNVGLAVPADASGVNVPVTVSLVGVGTGYAGASNSSVTAKITTLTYNDGTTVQSISPTAITVTHNLVASKPTMTMTASNGSGLVNGNIKVGEFTVAADAAGDIKLEAIPVTIDISGAAAITASTVQLRDASGNTQITGTNSLSASGTFTFSTPRTITKGTSETFTVWATFNSVSGAANTMSETFSLDSANKANFLWTDVIGNQASITGAQMNTYPNTTQTKNN